MARATAESAAFPISVSSRGSVRADEEAYVRAKAVAVAKLAPMPVLFARVKVTRFPHRSVERPALVEVAFDVNGRVVRAHVAASEVREAADLVEARLHRKLADLASHLRSLRSESGIAQPGEWRHGDMPSHRPGYFPRPVEEREIVRRKSFSLGRMRPEEAALEMEILDHAFHLFVDEETGEDAVVYRVPEGTGFMRARTPARDDPALGIVAGKTMPPTATVEDAVRALNLSGEPFEFFIDAASGRGDVIYRRYDGHHGLVSPAEGTWK